MRHAKTVPAPQSRERAISRRRFIGVTAGATAALSFGTFIRSGLGAARINVLTWSNTLNAMDDTLREQAKQYSKEKGVEVVFEFVNQTDLPTKTAAAIESGSGDIVTTWSDGAHLHDKALINVGDIAEPLGKQLNGWTNIAKDICVVNKVWKAVPWGIIPIAIVYRTDWAKEAGYDKFPDTYDEMLVLCRKMKEKGHYSGFALGRAIGDSNQSHYPMLWAHGGAGLSWDDASNNRAFLAGELACTGNAASIYWAETKNAPQLRDVTNHALWPKGPAGRFGYSTSMGLGIYRFSKFQKECKAFLTWLMQPTQYSAWIGVGEGQIAGLANFYENDPVWKKDPKLEVIREIPKYVRMPGFPGPPTRHAAESMVKYVIVNMFARACKGTSTPETIKQAEAELKEIYAKA